MGKKTKRKNKEKRMTNMRNKVVPQDWDSTKIAEYLKQQKELGYKYDKTEGTFDGTTYTLTISLESEA